VSSGGEHIRAEALMLAHQQEQILKAAVKDLIQDPSEIVFEDNSEPDIFNPFVMGRKSESLETRIRKEAGKSESSDEQHLRIEELQALSEEFQKKNKELEAKTLISLRSQLKAGDTKEDILRKVLESYPDPALADEALDFLLRTTEGELAEQVRLAKQDLAERYAREIKSGRNIQAQTAAFSKEGVGGPQTLRDLYRDVTGNPREVNTLFEELSGKYTFDQMKPIVDFLLHSLGSDLKAQGPSIARAELYRLLTEVRSLQAILGVYRFFRLRMYLLQSNFIRRGARLPGGLNFESLARAFMKFLQERYPSADKALLMAALFELEDDYEGAIPVYMQLRDAVRNVAPKLFRSEQHRQDILKSFIESLNELEDRAEEDEEEDEE